MHMSLTAGRGQSASFYLTGARADRVSHCLALCPLLCRCDRSAPCFFSRAAGTSRSLARLAAARGSFGGSSARRFAVGPRGHAASDEPEGGTGGGPAALFASPLCGGARLQGASPSSPGHRGALPLLRRCAGGGSAGARFKLVRRTPLLERPEVVGSLRSGWNCRPVWCRHRSAAANSEAEACRVGGSECYRR
jgi:hypothetical protein